uniref:Uncharacterized protein n=1 Tax=Cucumis melo TaxID=3656 RepID=A0A9I9D724_CUCME
MGSAEKGGTINGEGWFTPTGVWALQIKKRTDGRSFANKDRSKRTRSTRFIFGRCDTEEITDGKGTARDVVAWANNEQGLDKELK